MRATIDKTVASLLIIIMSVMTLDVLWGVFTRYALGNQASWSEELARFSLIWIGVLGAAYASGKKMHLAIDLLKPKLEEKNQVRINMFINSLIIFFAFTVMIIGGGRLIYVTNVLGQTSPALQVPMYLLYSVVPISGLLVIYYKILDFNK